MMLGLWLVTSPFTLGYLSDFAPDANHLRVMAVRGLSAFELRNLLMTWSDVISGLLVIIFGAPTVQLAQSLQTQGVRLDTKRRGTAAVLLVQ